jgi:hypothetical protein
VVSKSDERSGVMMSNVKIVENAVPFQPVTFTWDWPAVPQAAREVAPAGKRKNGKGR